jgi:hypothetical protein
LAVASNPFALRHANFVDKEILNVVFSTPCSDYPAVAVFVPEEFLADEDVLHRMVLADWRCLKLVPRKHFTGKLLRLAIDQCGTALSYAPPEYREDKEYVLLAVAKSTHALMCVPSWLRHDQNVICTALRGGNPAAMVLANERAEEAALDRELSGVAPEKKGAGQETAPGGAKKTVVQQKKTDVEQKKTVVGPKKTVVAAAEAGKPKKAGKGSEGVRPVPRHGLQGDRKFAALACGINGGALEYVNPEVQSDREVVQNAVEKNGLALQSAAPKLRNDKKIVKKAIEQNPASIQYASERLRSMEEIIEYVVERDPLLVKYAEGPVKNLKSFAKEIVARDGNALQFFNEELRSSLEVAEIAVHQNAKALRFVGDDLLKNQDLVLNALEQNGSCQAYLTPEHAAEPVVHTCSQRVREANAVKECRADVERLTKQALGQQTSQKNYS